ncbi:MAG: FecR domain-containing protein [Bacteroidetes bacterium]|nr:FecR domain-containing protein [Bacteroidota bacterium]MCL6103753.1 FecR domain-containing protein [Bacteroidota bacterium]
MDNLRKYLEDIFFISWVFEPTTELDLFWKQFHTEHTEEAKNIQMARKIILQFRTVAKSLSEEDKILLFSRVLKQIEEKQKSKKTTRIFIGLLKYAAVALIFFSIGALLFYRPSTINPAFYAFNLEEQISDNQAQLIRSNGENVILDDKRSIIKYQKNGELVINKDTLKPTGSDSKTGIALNQLIIPYGKTSEILLPDGTKVVLNAGSRLAYPDHFKGGSREVLLLGEAYFEVKHDSKHPFVVQVNDLRIEDLGTRFNVSAYPADSRIETVLTEGKVSISQNNPGLFTQATELIPGQLASFDRQTSQIKVKSVDVDDYTLWTQGIMKFESVDLSRILKKMERFYNIHFQFNDPLLGLLKISGKLELKEDKNEVVDRIAHTASVNIINKGNDLYEILK